MWDYVVGEKYAVILDDGDKIKVDDPSFGPSVYFTYKRGCRCITDYFDIILAE